VPVPTSFFYSLKKVGTGVIYLFFLRLQNSTKRKHQKVNNTTPA